MVGLSKENAFLWFSVSESNGRNIAAHAQTQMQTLIIRKLT